MMSIDVVIKHHNFVMICEINLVEEGLINYSMVFKTLNIPVL